MNLLNAQRDTRAYLDRWTPLGSQTRSKGSLYANPAVAKHVEGAYVWDEAGTRYLDWISGLCAISLGYGHPEVDAAVIAQIKDYGVTFPLPTRLEAEVAEALIETIGFGEQVRWVKTGSEATDGAMLIARAATKRQRIVSIGYHGWHAAHQPGPDLIDVPWGREFGLEAIDHSTAAVLIEACRDYTVTPDGYDVRDYLKRVQHRAAGVGALLIVDEIVTGLRWNIGGATAYFDLVPDLVCYGKAMANGYPVAAIVGPRRLMRYADQVSSTFGGEGVGLAAAKATLAVYRRDKVIERLWAIGSALIAGGSHLFDGSYPCHPVISADAARLGACLATDQILIHPSGGLNPTAAHTADDVELTCVALNIHRMR